MLVRRYHRGAERSRSGTISSRRFSGGCGRPVPCRRGTAGRFVTFDDRVLIADKGTGDRSMWRMDEFKALAFIAATAVMLVVALLAAV